MGRSHQRALKLPARGDLSLLPPPSFVGRRDLPPASGRTTARSARWGRRDLPSRKREDSKNWSAGVEGAGRVGRSHQRHLISQPEGPLPPTSALLRRAQGPSSRKREDSRSLRSLGAQEPWTSHSGQVDKGPFLITLRGRHLHSNVPGESQGVWAGRPM